MRRIFAQRTAGGVLATWALAGAALAGDRTYTLMELGVPEGADSVVGVRMNGLGQVAGWSQYFGEEPALRGWVWTPGEGFTMLPSPPGTFNGRFRAIDISDSGIVAGDGGFDSGPAWRYEDGEFTTIDPIDGQFIGVMGGVNEAGDVAGWLKDATIVTPDVAFLSINGGETINLTPADGGRATDLNDAGQVCGYTEDQHAVRWTVDGAVLTLGDLGLARSFANRTNDAGSVVGSASSANGNTTKAWIYTDAGGQQLIPGVFENSSAAYALNIHHEVVGMTGVAGPDIPWLWTEAEGVMKLTDLFDFGAHALTAPVVADINDEGMILLRVFDNGVPDFRMVILVPEGGCDADFNGDGSLDILDFVAFQNAFTGGDGAADCDGSGSLNILDFVCFQNLFGTGCP